MTLPHINFNLLPALRTLLREQSVSRAARILNLSQPATSHALRRLRLLFDDPLLIKVGRKMQLTSRAQSLLPKLEQFCSSAESLLREPSFDPRIEARSFVIATPDYVALLLGMELLAQLRDGAPGVTIRFVDARLDYPQLLQEGKLDVAIVAFDEEMARGLARSRGFPDRMVGVVNRKHPLARAKHSAAEFRSYPELRVTVGAGESGAPLEPLPSDLSGRIRIIAEQFMVLPLLAAKSDCVAVVPCALAEYFVKVAPVTILELPGSGWKFDACAVWTRTRDADPAHAWLRGVIETSMSRCLNLTSARGKR